MKLLNRVSFFSNFINKPVIEEEKIKNIESFLDFVENNTNMSISESEEEAIDSSQLIKKKSQETINQTLDGIIIKSKPSEVLKFKLDPNIDYTITQEDDYFRTQLNPPIIDDFFRYGLHKFSLTLKDDFPESAYMDDRGEFYPKLPNGIPASTLKYKLKYHNHWGQRKLLLTEIDLLTYALEKNDDPIDIIYAGAAHGIHLPYLFHLFPNIRLHLYDPAVFSEKLLPYMEEGKIIINEFYHSKYDIDKYTPFKTQKTGIPENYGFFTDEVSEYIRNKFFDASKNYSNCLFVSDIRRDLRKQPNETYEEYNTKFERLIFEDQINQQNWIKIMRPKYSMLKFKLPYVEEGRQKYYKHMKGIIRFQTWHPSNSAETRLIIKHTDIDTDVHFNIISYERKNAYYNYLRQIPLNNKMIKFYKDDESFISIPLKNICSKVTTRISYNTLDFYNEIFLLYKYLQKYNKLTTEENTIQTIIDNMRRITSIIDRKGNPDQFILKRKEGD